ncbi:MAG: class I SAM-dependent methyltransferase [Bacteroidales bacterium]|nr:class I SAM-dependent methyltransferase [Bacteroidales bacterium]
MSFYQSISDVYHKIFPLNPNQVQFVLDTMEDIPDVDLLDIGCGTGDLSIALSRSFQRVVGIDLDKAMLHRAQTVAAGIGNLEFIPMNMLNIGARFGPGTFDAITCFGNTLVHLDSMDSIFSFIHQCENVLRSDGRLLIQIINYDRILDQDVRSLPTIENNDIRFVRNYRYLEELHRIEFETTLTIKSDDRVIQNSIMLYPLRKQEMTELLMDAGFRKVRPLGNFAMAPYTAGGIPFVIEAIK